jgi:hypothetical protein
MKKTIPAPARAVSAKPNPVPHAELRNPSNTCVREFVDQDGYKLTANWICPPFIRPGSDVKQPVYSLTIKRENGADTSRPYSLCNLSVQGSRWPVYILGPNRRSVTFLNANGEIVKATQTGSVGGEFELKLPSLRTKNSNAIKSGPPFDKNLIHFVKFEGVSCSLTIRSGRPWLDPWTRPKPIKPWIMEVMDPSPIVEPGGDVPEEKELPVDHP